ncbi:hypothetical protein [Aeromonas hydrophila]|uniref:hypothetical protein n=1 Tax=Aeromonas hydrophila TaxID=644 RepID=UPI003EC6127F
MADLLLVQQPAKESNSKVWFNGKWENAEQAGIPVKEAGKIKPSDLPDVAIVPKWDINESYKKYQLVSRSNMIYKALADIPAGTDFQVVNTDAVDFTGWTLVSNPSASAVFKSYNDLVAENHLFKVGEVITNNNVLYQVAQQNVAASIYNENFFTPLKTNVVLDGFEITKTYKAGSLVIYGVSENVWVCIKDVPAGNIFNAGKEWVRINESSTPLLTKFGRFPNATTKPVNAPKEYYDYELKLMMLNRNDGSWAQHDGVMETITFPTNPVNNQTFTSTFKNSYTYDSTNLYWKLTTTGGSSSDVRATALFSRGAEQTSLTTGSVWDINTTNFISGDSISRNGANITLLAGRKYKLTWKIDPASLTAANWIRYGIYNNDASSWVANQSYATRWMTNSSGYLPNGMGFVIIETTANTIVSLRCRYAGSAHNIRSSLDTSDDAGDSYLLVEEIGGDNITDARNTVILQGDRTDYLMAKMNGNYTAAGNNTAFDLPFTTNITSIGEVVNNSGVFTLKANKTYELVADIFTSIAGSGRVGFAWHDSSNNRLPGTYGGKTATNSTEQFSSQSVARTIITPTSDMQVKVRVVYDTGGSHTIYADDNSLGSTYAIIRQIGSSKVVTSEVVVSPNDPKNYWTRDVINPNYDVSKHITDWYFVTHTSDIAASQIALKVGETSTEKQARAWFLYQKFNVMLSGTLDNDLMFDGLLSGTGAQVSTLPTLYNTGRFSGATLPMAISDVDPVLSAGISNTTTIAGTPTEYFKLCIGRDNANNIHWITVCPMQYWNTSTQTGQNQLIIGLAFWNGSAWTYPGGGGNLTIYSSTSMSSATANGQTNNSCNAGTPLVQYMPHRLELA